MKILFLARATLYSQPGGDTVQMVESAKALRTLNVYVDIKLKGEKIDFSEYQLLHFFNLGRPADLIPYLPQIRIPIVVSTIWVSYGKGYLKETKEYAKTIARWLNGSDSYPGWLYIQMGQKKSLQLVLDRAKNLVTTTNKEASRLKTNWPEIKNITTIAPGLSEVFTEPSHSTIRKGSLVIGRVEKLKNQHVAISACNSLNEPLSVIGNAAKNQKEYYQICKKIAGTSTTFLPFLKTEELIKLYRESEILILPSHFETYGLVALEAWSQGCKLVLSKNIESKSFFKDKALFFDPNDQDDLKTTILKAKKMEQPAVSASEIDKMSWVNSAKQLVETYNSCLS